MATKLAIGETQTAHPKPAAMPWHVFWGRILGVVIPLAVWFAPLDLEEPVQRALAIASFIIISWITQAYDHALAGLIGCFLFWALGIASFPQAFAGFANSTTWFLFGAMLFGMMAGKTGLARRLANLVMLAVGNTYSRLLLGIIISDFLLTFLVPSGIARVAIMASVEYANNASPAPTASTICSTKLSMAKKARKSTAEFER